MPESLPYLVLLRVGFALPPVLPPARCALTAPFHPCHSPGGEGGIFSVALSVGSRPPGVTWHPALWSPDFPPPRSVKNRDSACLADSCRRIVCSRSPGDFKSSPPPRRCSCNTLIKKHIFPPGERRKPAPGAPRPPATPNERTGSPSSGFTLTAPGSSTILGGEKWGKVDPYCHVSWRARSQHGRQGTGRGAREVP